MCHGSRLALLAVLALAGQAAADPNDAEKHRSGQEPSQDGAADAVADLLALPEHSWVRETAATPGLKI